MWHTVAMAASNMLLLDTKSGPLRVYVEELKPTPEGDLEILLQKRWVFSPSTWNSPSPGLWTPPGVGCRWDQGPRDGERGSEVPVPSEPSPGPWGKKPITRSGPGVGVGRDLCAGRWALGLGSCCQESCLSQRRGAET